MQRDDIRAREQCRGALGSFDTHCRDFPFRARGAIGERLHAESPGQPRRCLADIAEADDAEGEPIQFRERGVIFEIEIALAHSTVGCAQNLGECHGEHDRMFRYRAGMAPGSRIQFHLTFSLRIWSR